jgi:hypothetical protein
MRRRYSVLAGMVMVVAALALVVPLVAQQAASPATVSAKNPLRFTAFAVSMQAGGAGVVNIAIERWTTDDERQGFLTVLAQKGQDRLIDALQDIKVRNGYIRTPNSIGWDIKYARENMLPDGTRQIVIVTDKPVSFLAVASQARVLDYPFSLIEMRFPKGKTEGEGKLLAATSISIKNQRLELENYGQEPVRLTSIKEEKQRQ